MAQQPIQALLGETVIDNNGANVPVSSFVGEGKTIGIYFSAHWCPPCRGFTPNLAKFYNSHHIDKNFEIVFASSDRDEGSFKEYFAEMPWKALPYSDREKKETLSKKFKVQGIPMLVFLDCKGEIVNKNARTDLLNDPEAKGFPWKLPSYSEIMTGKLLKKIDEEIDCKDALKGKITGLYFSAHWCPPCRQFTPELVKTYNKLKEDGKNFEIVFASSDRGDDEFKDYFGGMPWLAIPFGDKRKKLLSTLFDIQGIPSLVIMDENGKAITTNGRALVGADLTGKNFPWYPKPVNDLSSAVDDVNDHPCLILFAGADDKEDDFTKEAEEMMKESAELEAKKEEKSLYFIYAPESDMCDGLKEFIKLDTKKRSLMIIDVSRQEKYAIAEGNDITKEKIKETVQKFIDKKLDDKKSGIGQT